ncbi:MAG: polysaccharide export protein [Acidobacteria bacterium]|nr:MAG: polysaccharide export protein [Acidobacteriota bacterium]
MMARLVVVMLMLGSAVVFARQNVESGAPAQAAAAPAADEYVLQAGDEIAVRVFNHMELDDRVQIRPDGRVSLLLANEVQAAGLTSRQLDDVLTERFSRLYRDAEVSVIVRTFAGNKVYVAGEVGQPGVLPIVGRFTALTAVLQAGGFKNTARTDYVILLRNREGKPAVARLNLRSVLAGGSGDVNLQPFDVVYVPKSAIAKVDQFVDQYIRQLIPIGTNAGFTYVLPRERLVVPQ